MKYLRNLPWGSSGTSDSGEFIIIINMITYNLFYYMLLYIILIIDTQTIMTATHGGHPEKLISASAW